MITSAGSRRAGVPRRPEPLAPQLGSHDGFGQQLFALGDLKKSEAAFRQTCEAHPREGTSFNNLAHVLLSQGVREEALEAARRAVALGGPLRNVFQTTLEEIEATAP